MEETKPGNLSNCEDIQGILKKIKSGNSKPKLDIWAMIQAHFKTCDNCCEFFNNEF